jgi:hypothetical protein
MSLSSLKASDLSTAEINKILGDAWLNIHVDENKLYNPLLTIPESCADFPHLYITWLMTQPEYFSFICSQILNVNIWPMQGVMLKEIWHHKFPMLIGSRGLSKSFTLALYAILRMLLFPGRKIIITGAAFRQSKIIFEYMENIWYNAPLLRDICSGREGQGPFHQTDVWTFRLGDSVCKALPLGNGEKIRGQRANDILADEFASIVREIFETVIAGFAAVKASPIEALKTAASRRLAQVLNIEMPEEDDVDTSKENQIVISGTAYYDFNHFAEYWKKWRSIIVSGGDIKELERLFGSGKVPSAFNWKDYSIIRIPFELIPPGFMDEAQVARSRATIHAGIYEMEFGAIFSKDSNGFFKRSLVEQCVASPDSKIILPNGNKPIFGPVVRGEKDKSYVMAIDPASEIDNFAIIIMELADMHRRIVYCWTTNKADYELRKKDKLCSDGDFYAFCARKIRALMKVFNIKAIAIDSQGGGHQIVGCLSNKELMQANERPLYPVIDPTDPKESDGQYGDHIIHIINFADADWTAKANHGLRGDFESKITLFPYNDAVDIALAMTDKEMTGSVYDTLEDCIFEIEELKNELATIIVTQTPNGRDKWDTPEIKLPGSKKGRMRKDRYSALIMANAVASTMQNTPQPLAYSTEMGWAQRMLPNQVGEGRMYVGPNWLADALNNIYN